MDRLEKLMRKYERGDMARVDWLDHLVFREIEKINKHECATSKKLYLYIDLPQFDFPLVFNEKEYTLPPSLPARSLDSDLLLIADPDFSRDNPVENKHRKLARSHRNGPLDRDLKPNAKIRDELNKILRYPPTQSLTTEEKDLLWKFRFYLTRDKKALTKFLKSVVWTDPIETKQAVDLLLVWVDIDVQDALELLGPGFENFSVRGFAVLQLKKADDDELLLYLLQLVQALKFEGLAGSDPRPTPTTSTATPTTISTTSTNNITTVLESPLAEFLIGRGIKNPILGNYFHWYLMVECEDKQVGKMYARVAYQFMTSMMEVPEEFHRRDVLRRQGELIATLAKISKELRASKEARPRKIERLQALISDPKNGLLSFPPLPLPLDAQVQVTGIVPEKASVFKSALSPLRLHFLCLDGSEYPVIFKTGDDLRQDQLVVQIITLMDQLLRKENLDLRLTPYKVLATGADHGMVQFIPSAPLATILAEHGNSLLNYLKEYSGATASRGGTTTGGIPNAIMDNYIRSCAGYCVITYLLGIGDRHLDNLMLTVTGNLFHIDFGFILGRDPKPFPPPMKLSREMVETMGGAASPSYNTFKSYCFIAYNSLRKSANLILNLFSLMVGANIPDIAIEPDKAVWKVQERFRLDLTDEEAIQHFQGLINESLGAVFPQVMEKIHQVAQLLRS
ncbi:Phosphatidylinositol (PI) 3-kinase [Borealophlyctis nickersoniae]|nr:Phosphatidylinositol (PI) 3-kinase [Borealophlyctis nickersoniae]